LREELGRTAYSEVLEDYLKQIYLTLKENQPATTQVLAKTFKVSPPTVTQTIKRLKHLGLVNHHPYRGVTLTKEGERIALEIIRHHRLVELYLHHILGIPWEKVHKEAERWEHVISEEVENRMAEILGEPTVDPHGAPIPGKDLDLPPCPYVSLRTLNEGAVGTIGVVEDEDPSFLKLLQEKGIRVGEKVSLLSKGEKIKLRVGKKVVHLSLSQSEKIWVEERKSPGSSGL
jgi:DtxR family Mn-dependent transcriptional regulator